MTVAQFLSRTISIETYAEHLTWYVASYVRNWDHWVEEHHCLTNQISQEMASLCEDDQIELRPQFIGGSLRTARIYETTLKEYTDFVIVRYVATWWGRDNKNFNLAC